MMEGMNERTNEHTPQPNTLPLLYYIVGWKENNSIHGSELKRIHSYYSTTNRGKVSDHGIFLKEDTFFYNLKQKKLLVLTVFKMKFQVTFSFLNWKFSGPNRRNWAFLVLI